MGRGKKSDLFRHCQETQQEIADDYEHIEVDEDVLLREAPDLFHSKYIQGVLARGEFVKATELGRLFGLWFYGGVYMDCDVELLRRPDSLLRDPFFIGREDNEFLNGAVMGAEARNEIITTLLQSFPTDTDGKLGAHIYGPTFLTRALQVMQVVDGNAFKAAGGVIYDPDYFFPSHWSTPDKFEPTSRTIAWHRWAKSWVGLYLILLAVLG